MSRDLTPLPIDESGNGSRLRTMTYDVSDAPMLMHAMSLGAGTALVCGGKTSINRFKHYQAQFAETAHPGAEFMKRDTDLCEIAIIATAVPTWSIHRERRNTYSDDFQGVITIGTRTFESEYTIDEEKYQAIIDMLVQTLPFSCERVDAEDVEPKRW